MTNPAKPAANPLDCIDFDKYVEAITKGLSEPMKPKFKAALYRARDEMIAERLASNQKTQVTL